MSIGPMKYEGGVVETTLSPASGSEAVNSYGTLTVTAMKKEHIAMIVWTGNSTAPTQGAYTFTLPSDYIPKRNAQVPLRRGDGMEVRVDGTVVVRLTTSSYSGATITYILNK